MFKYAIGLSVAALLGGIAAYPAQALTPTGRLAFSDGADDWFSEVNPGINDTFDIEFNPFDLNFITTQNGDFTPPFDGSPVQGVQSSVGTFEYVSMAASKFTYELTNDLVFAYDNGATVSWLAGSLVEGMFNTPDSVEFSFLPSQVSVTGIGEDVTVIDSLLQFSDTLAAGGGTYNAQVDVTSEPISVPEPGVLAGLGVLVLGGVRFRKSQAS